MHRHHRILATMTIGLAVSGMTASTAAASPIPDVKVRGSAGVVKWDESGDRLWVCDQNSRDRDSAVGVLQFRNSEGRWFQYARVADRTGAYDGQCSRVRHIVVAEGVPLRLSVCQQNGKSAPLRNCAHDVISGSQRNDWN